MINTYCLPKNQLQIIKLSKLKKKIFIKPVLLEGGNVEHYYHFILDLVFPLSLLIERTPRDVIFIFEEFGIFTERLHSLFPGRVETLKKQDIPADIEKVEMFGLSPRRVRAEKGAIQNFSTHIYNRLGVDQTVEPNKILLIERLPPDPYFLKQAKEKGAGASRRSILNHRDLSAMLQSMVKAPFEFHNLHLEKISFSEQVEYFNQARVVIAQHGAALANCVWMRPNSIVIELSSRRSFDHFRLISEMKEHNYYFYKTKSKHTKIKLNHFQNWILKDEHLSSFFG